MKIRTWIAKLIYDRRHRRLPRIGTDNPLSRASDGQGVYVAEALPNDDGSRVFVEIGGNDGVTLSNTYYLETEHGWGGVSVEPLPRAYRALARHRTCITVNACIAAYDGETPFSVENNYFTGEIEDHMVSCGYRMVAIAGRDEFYARAVAGRNAKAV